MTTHPPTPDPVPKLIRVMRITMVVALITAGLFLATAIVNLINLLS